MGRRQLALTALEFYSGIGGMHYALQHALPHAVVLEAFDINQAANTVYQHNFAKAPRQVDLVSLTAAQLDAYAADVWLMAPPCQPFTRQGKQLGGADARSNSFLHLLGQLPLMCHQPGGLLVENVVGFEGSDVHSQLVAALQHCGYHMQEFHLSPVQYGVPYSRPRYFCLASKQPLPVPLTGLQQPCCCPPALLQLRQQQGATQQDLVAAAQQPLASHVPQVPTLGEYLALPLNTPPPQQPQNDQLQQPQSNQQQQETQLQQQQQQLTWVPDKVLQRHADVIDVVSRSSRSCNCFTKAYGHFARGTGSLLATVADPSAVDDRWQLVGGSGSLELRGYIPPSARPSAADEIDGGLGQVTTTAAAATIASIGVTGQGGGSSDSSSGSSSSDSEDLAAAWNRLHLRYFTVQEIARLHSFPDSFTLPPGFSSRQGYQLLGNSLSVAVVADLISYLAASLADHC